MRLLAIGALLCLGIFYTQAQITFPIPPYGEQLEVLRGAHVAIDADGRDNSTMWLKVGIAHVLMTTLPRALIKLYLKSHPTFTISMVYTGVGEIAAESSRPKSANSTTNVVYPDVIMTYSEVLSVLNDNEVLEPLNAYFDNYQAETNRPLADSIPTAMWYDLNQNNIWLGDPFFFDVRGISVNLNQYQKARTPEALRAYLTYLAALPPADLTDLAVHASAWAATPEQIVPNTTAPNGRFLPLHIPDVPPLMRDTNWYAWSKAWTWETLRDHMDFYASQGVAMPLVEEECMMFAIIVSMAQSAGVNMVNSDGKSTSWDAPEFTRMLQYTLWPMLRGRPEQVCMMVNCNAPLMNAYIKDLQASDMNTEAGRAAWNAAWPPLRLLAQPRDTCWIPTACEGACSLYAGRNVNVTRTISPGDVTSQFSWAWSIAQQSAKKKEAWKFIAFTSNYDNPELVAANVALQEQPVLLHGANLPVFENARRANPFVLNLFTEREKARSPTHPSVRSPRGTYELEKYVIGRLLTNIFYSPDTNLTRRILAAQACAVTQIRYFLLPSCVVPTHTTLLLDDRFLLTRPMWNLAVFNATCRFTSRSLQSMEDALAAFANVSVPLTYADLLLDSLGARQTPDALPLGSDRLRRLRENLAYFALPLCTVPANVKAKFESTCSAGADSSALVSWNEEHVNRTCRLTRAWYGVDTIADWHAMTQTERDATGQSSMAVGMVRTLPCAFINEKSTLAASLIVLVTLCFLAQSVTAAALWRWRSSEVLRAGSWRWCVCIDMALALCGCSVLLDMGSLSPGRCVASVFCLSFGLAAILASLHVISYRIHEIFIQHAKSLNVVRLNDTRLLPRFLMLMGAQSVWFITYWATSGVRLSSTTLYLDGIGTVNYETCNYGSSLLMGAWLVGMMAVLACNMVYAYRIREMREEFNEKTVTAILSGFLGVALVVFIPMAMLSSERTAIVVKMILVSTLIVVIQIGFFGMKFATLFVRLGRRKGGVSAGSLTVIAVERRGDQKVLGGAGATAAGCAPTIRVSGVGNSSSSSPKVAISPTSVSPAGGASAGTGSARVSPGTLAIVVAPVSPTANGALSSKRSTGRANPERALAVASISEGGNVAKTPKPEQVYVVEGEVNPPAHSSSGAGSPESPQRHESAALLSLAVHAQRSSMSLPRAAFL